MTDYTLHYWPLPFRGEFIRAVLAHVGAEWQEVTAEDIIAEKSKDPADQLIPHMGPPVLTDLATGVSISQLPAILTYLGRKHGLTSDNPVREALTAKIVADANDVLYEMTLHNGAQMWTPESWEAYQPRLKRWMGLFEEIGRRHHLTAESGYILGTDAPDIADLVTAILWGTMTAKLPQLRPMLDSKAPAIAGLTDRISARPEQAELRARSDQAYGNGWCSGQIEASLRAVVEV